MALESASWLGGNFALQEKDEGSSRDSSVLFLSVPGTRNIAGEFPLAYSARPPNVLKAEGNMYPHSGRTLG